MKKLFSLSLLLSLVTVVMAEGITKEQALDRARQFMAKRNASFSQARGASGKSVNYSVSSLYDGKMYAVNAEGNGFVLVSGDDAADLILGYADNGTFTLDNAPENIRYWMECYAEQMEAIAQGKGKVRSASVSTIKDAISPLISTTWGQGSNQSPTYNSQCNIPLYGGANQYCVTGCYATAMAQIVNYHQFPESVTSAGFESYSYDVQGHARTTVPSLPGTTFDWANMPQSYSTASAEGKAAVATLMRYCGQAVKMAYGTGESSANSNNQYSDFVNAFGYDESARMIHRAYYTCYDWEELIYNELKDSRPILYNGQSTGGGHSFVVDGYDGGEHYHVNWGWDGSNDGYFLLSLMNPNSNTGTGASTTKDGYSFGQSALIGLKPHTGAHDPDILSVAVSHVEYKNVASPNSNLLVSFIKESGVGAAHYGIAVIDAHGVVSYPSTSADFSDAVENGHILGVRIEQLLSDKPDGIYKVTGAYKEKETWKLCQGANRRYLEVIISGSVIVSIVSHPLNNVSITGVELTGNGKVGESQEVRVKFANSGTDDYIEKVCMIDVAKNKICSFAGVNVPAGESAYAYFYFSPTTVGDISLKFGEMVNATGNAYYQIGSSTYNVSITGTVPTNLYVSNLSVENMITDNTSGNHYLKDNNLKMSFTITTPPTVGCAYGEGMISYKVTYTGGNASGGLPEFSLDGGNSLTLNVASMTVNGTATIQIFNKFIGAGHVIKELTVYQLGDKLIVRDASGSTSVIEKTATVPATATSVDLRHLGTSLSEVALTPSANPNCLYYLASGATAPACLSGKNVVIGSTAASLALQSGYNFRPLEDFTAASATYTTLFANGTDGTGSGWYSLCLPFSATSVSCGSQEKHWFNTAHPSADFWIYDFVSDNSTSVTFAKLEGSSVPANHPCIIAVPGNHWGNEYDLTNKSIVFSGSSVQIKADAAAAATGSYFKFIGGYTSNAVTDAYLLNAAGNSFLKTASGTSPQFGAYFVGVGTSTSDVLDIIVDNKETTAIGTISAPSILTDKVFNVMGQQVSPNAKGIKIIKGRKFIK